MPSSLYEIDNNGKLTLRLHPGQARVWRSQRRFVLMLAGTQGGKTSFGPWWLWREIQKHGRGDYLAVTTTFSLFMLKMLPEMTKVFCDILKIGRLWSAHGVIEIADPATGQFLASKVQDEMYARIILRSASSPAGLEAATANAAWLDECGQDTWDAAIWEAILRRLSLKQGRVLGTTTVYNMGYLRYEWYDHWASGDKEYDVIQFDSVLNPVFPRAEFERAERTMPKWRFEMFYRGRFARPAGLIYDMLEEEMWVDPFIIPQEWEGVVGIDFGGANTATVWLAHDPRKDLWYLHYESLGGNKSSREHAEEIVDKAGRRFPLLEFAGGAASEKQARMDFGEGGVHVQAPFVTDVEGGISRVIELIKTDKLRIFKTMAGLRHEFATYRRKLDELGLATNDIMNKNTFHRLDALRYAATLIDLGDVSSMLDLGHVDGYRHVFDVHTVKK